MTGFGIGGDQWNRQVRAGHGVSGLTYCRRDFWGSRREPPNSEQFPEGGHCLEEKTLVSRRTSGNPAAQAECHLGIVRRWKPKIGLAVANAVQCDMRCSKPQATHASATAACARNSSVAFLGRLPKSIQAASGSREVCPDGFRVRMRPCAVSAGTAARLCSTNSCRRTALPYPSARSIVIQK